jgi:hypothetical protein
LALLHPTVLPLTQATGLSFVTRIHLHIPEVKVGLPSPSYHIAAIKAFKRITNLILLSALRRFTILPTHIMHDQVERVVASSAKPNKKDSIRDACVKACE